ncbi:retropepsin-like aspartic protease [Allosphingosinicella vermicomposti]|uniref:retropepsin-like aspartic protease n=1 Tax=Allosphingosinicella vermicomposti TaxID=614671 RepID=UPI00131A4DCA|nr:retropepsin-like aspartic protease [Allosphingosinicella vermicomposti]
MTSLLTGTAADAAPPKAQPEAVIELIPWRNRWVMEAEIGGKVRKYLFDTGGGLTLIHPDTAKAAGCEPWGQLTGFRMMGQRGDGPRCDGLAMKVGGLTLAPQVLTLIDMGQLNPLDSELDGIIGLNLFENKTITIDFAAGIVTIENEASRNERIADLRPLPIRLKREVDGLALAVHAAVPTEKGPVFLELDSGNGGTILINKPIAQLLGMDPKAEGKQKADFKVVGDIRATTEDAFTPDMIMEGNLGMPFLRNWVITLDLAHGLAWIGKPPVPPRPALPLPPPPTK